MIPSSSALYQIFLLPRVSTDIPIFFFFKKIRRKGKFRREKREKASFQDHIPISRYRCIDRGTKRAQLEAVANRSNYPFKAARAIAADRTFRWKRNQREKEREGERERRGSRVVRQARNPCGVRPPLVLRSGLLGVATLKTSRSPGGPPRYQANSINALFLSRYQRFLSQPRSL